jgi:hypothetical protein
MPLRPPRAVPALIDSLNEPEPLPSTYIRSAIESLAGLGTPAPFLRLND